MCACIIAWFLIIVVLFIPASFGMGIVRGAAANRVKKPVTM